MSEIGDISSAEGINGLIWISHNKEIVMPPGQNLHQLILQLVDILKFINQNVLQTFLPARTSLRKLLQNNQGESNEPSANIQDWKENLLKSANDFASRFVEVRRRDAEAATEFLTPEQDLFLRENIKTRILLAKADLSHGDKANMQSNLNAALGLISTYFDPESAITQSTLKELSTLASSEITIETPQVLSSVSAFSQYAHEHLLGRGVASHD